MTNPYKPPTTIESIQEETPAINRHRFAGIWIAANGMFHFLLVNYMNDRNSGGLDDDFLYLVGLGVFVAFGFRWAMGLARLFGSFAVFGLCVFLVVFLLSPWIDSTAESELHYGSIVIKNPTNWHLAISWFAFAFAVLPPWWHLQIERGEWVTKRREIDLKKLADKLDTGSGPC
ncbi:hypothetical protein Q31b_10740 [Novipirellula aureliae]|uniref:Uncharacterized protein n=1 Tax=Novipirellula aureliae TaxID=2527966 RepID=A0A5C6EAL3_9BACT|nr:hypothetical protein [Novipirellula aureliae]TWU45898.1 hypothetical protein Q31b_10740 [Novipirellula aureliae]